LQLTAEKSGNQGGGAIPRSLFLTKLTGFVVILNDPFWDVGMQFTEGRMARNVVIVGGGAGGASTAAEAKRRDPSLNVSLVERGDYVSYSS